MSKEDDDFFRKAHAIMLGLGVTEYEFQIYLKIAGALLEEGIQLELIEKVTALNEKASMNRQLAQAKVDAGRLLLIEAEEAE
jgi:hypothetical protein